MRDHIELWECMQYALLTEATGRTNFLVTTYGAKLDAKWQVDMANESAAVRGNVKMMPGDTMAQKLVNYIQSFDPSSNGQYTQWMVQRYLKNGLSLKDLPETKDYLALFGTMKTKKQIPAGQGDINAYQGFGDLIQGMRQHRASLLPARLDKKWKATGGSEPRNVQIAVMSQKSKTMGEKVLSYIASFDPSGGQHVYWLGVTWLTNGLRLEDLDAARDDLQTFDKMTVDGTLNVDLDKVSSLAQLAALVRKADTADNAVVIDTEETKMLAQTDVLLDDDDLRILKPLTQAAACYFGRNTDWCTAWGSHTDLGLSQQGRYPSRGNQFEHYNNQGPLYIIEIKQQEINGYVSQKRRLYQYHSESNQFANSKDKMLSNQQVEMLLSDHPEIKEVIGDALDSIADLYAKDGMTEKVIKKISESLASKLSIGTYEPDHKRFVVERWNKFESFIDSIYDKNVDTILEIALGKSDLQKHGNVEDDFITVTLDMPPQLQTKLLDRAGMSPEPLSDERITNAAKRLIPYDDWFALFKQLHSSPENLKHQAWERLSSYAAIGWPFVGDGVYSNIPDGDDIEEFITSKIEVQLYVEETDMIQYGMEGEADDSDYGSDVQYSLLKMTGQEGDGWETIDDEYIKEQRRDAGLMQGDNDKWLQELAEGDIDGNLTLDFIDALGNKSIPAIDDPRQQQFKFESRINRLRRLAGLLLE